MSRSNPSNEEIVNPCKRWFQWDGDGGKGLKEYNKETKKNEIIPLPFKFLVIDRLITATGFNEPRGVGYWANEVRDLKKDKLVVRSKDGIECEGIWADVSAKLGTQGLDFCQSVYIAFFEGKTLMLGNIKMKGAALGNWFNFCKENKVMEIGVTIKDAKMAKKGKVEYFEPIFTAMPIKEETNNAAIEIDKELQCYLKAYLERNSTSTESPKQIADETAVTTQSTAKIEHKDLPWDKETVEETQSKDIKTSEEEESPF